MGLCCFSNAALRLAVKCIDGDRGARSFCGFSIDFSSEVQNVRRRPRRMSNAMHSSKERAGILLLKEELKAFASFASIQSRVAVEAGSFILTCSGCHAYLAKVDHVDINHTPSDGAVQL